MPERYTAKVKPVDTGRKPAVQNVEIEYVPGPRPYLWVGNDDECFGTVDKRQMETLARRILDA